MAVTPYLLGLPDGRTVQISRLLYLVVEHLDGTTADVAARVTPEYGRPVSGTDVQFLLERKLAPLGVVTGRDAPVASVAPPSRSVAAVRFRGAVLPERAVGAAASALRPLFWPPLVVAVVAGVIALDVWLARRGIGRGVVQVLANPAVTLMVAALVAASAGFHELGHAAACRYGGGRPGRIGVGVFVVWPAFFSDISDSYRLSRSARLRTDLGGVYFNAVFALAAASGYAATGFEPLLVVVILEHLLIACQLLPILRLDGYYLLSDLAGVPDLARWMRPALSKRAPGLLPRARAIVRAWTLLCVVLGVLAVMAGWRYGPALAATERTAVTARIAAFGDAVHRGDAARGAVATIAIAAALISLVGLVAMAVTLGRVATAAVGRRRRRRRRRRQIPEAVPLPVSGGRAVVGGRGCQHRRPPRKLTTVVGVCGLLGLWAYCRHASRRGPRA